MKDKHLAVRIQQCLALAEASNCPRRTFGALLVDPKRNVVLMDGYNGGPRGGGRLCGGEECLRDTMNIESDARVEIPVVLMQMNLICNAAANGVPTNNAWLIVLQTCMMCAKLIHHAGIDRVVIVDSGFAGENGVDYLENHGVEIQRTDGPKTRVRKPDASVNDHWVPCCTYRHHGVYDMNNEDAKQEDEQRDDENLNERSVASQDMISVP